MLSIDSHLGQTDLRRLASIHRAAFPSFFLSTLGEPFLRQFYAGFIDDPSAVVVIARESAPDATTGRPRPSALGAAVGTTDPAGFYRRLLKRRWAGFVTASIRATLRSPGSARRLLSAVSYRGGIENGAEGDTLLSSICIHPDHQGSGVGGRLLDSWTQVAHRAGGQRAFLTTDGVDNDDTLRFYRNHGWSPSQTFQTREGRQMQRLEFALGEEQLRS